MLFGKHFGEYVRNIHVYKILRTLVLLAFNTMITVCTLFGADVANLI